MNTNRLSYLFDVDSYKASHYLQYPPNTTSMFSYIESRGGDYEKTVFFGLQYYLKEYLSHRVTIDEVEEASQFFDKHGVPFNKDGWLYIATMLDGKLPVKIRAVPEGTVVPISNILVSVESTDPYVPWIVSWIETMIVRYVWYGTTVATISYHVKQDIMKALKESADDPASEIGFKLHDFGSRGVSSQESAMIGGAAHLVNFLGSDTIAGIRCANDYYNSEMAGFSIPAAEHSSITAWGRENEAEAYRNMLKQYAKPGAIISVVSDSYDIYNACSNIWGKELKQEVIDSGAVVVIRPDSGEPREVVLECLSRLEEAFGSTVNSKGYRVLNNVKVIQGDGIGPQMIFDIMDDMMNAGFSITNIAFGMGGGLLQKLNRDTQQFAMKCSHIIADGNSIDVYKQPITDMGKNSKRGRLDLKIKDGKFVTKNIASSEQYLDSAMRTVYMNGELVTEDIFDDIRARTNLA